MAQYSIIDTKCELNNHPVCGVRIPPSWQEMTDPRGELSFDFKTTSFEELSQCLFDYLALSTQAAFGLCGINLQSFCHWVRQGQCSLGYNFSL